MAKKPNDESSSAGPGTTLEFNADLFRSLQNLDVRLVLSHRGTEHEVTPASRVMLIGRSDECDLVVAHPFASRIHARIVYRLGKFVLIDQSKNGTYIRPDGGEEVCLNEQEEFPLAGEGQVGLGQPIEAAGEDAIGYRLEQV